MTDNYIAAIVAVRFDGKGMELECYPVTLQASSRQDAERMALEEAGRRWPVSEFWGGHSATARLRRNHTDTDDGSLDVVAGRQF